MRKKQKFKISIIIMFLIILAVTIMPYRVEAASFTKQYVYVVADSLNARTGPGTTYKVKSAFSYGKKLWAVSQSGSWTKVSTSKSSGTYYWVSSSYLSLSNPFGGGVKAPSVGEDVYVSTTSGLAGRRGPGADYKKVLTYGYKTKLRVYAVNGSWAKVANSGGTRTWVSWCYTSSNVPGSSSKHFVTASTLNVRKSASTSSAIVAKLPKGTEVKVVNTVGSWKKIQYWKGKGYRKGWAYGAYIS